MESKNVNQSVLTIAAIFIIVCGVFLSAMSMLIGKDPSKDLVKIFYIASTALFFAILGALSFSLFQKRNHQQLSLVAIIITVIGFTSSSIAILAETESKVFVKCILSFTVLSIALAQICMLYKINIINSYAAMSRIIAVATISIFSLIMIVLIFQGFDDIPNVFMRGSGINESVGRAYIAILSLDLAFTAATPILNKLEKGRYEMENIEEDFLRDVETEEAL